MLTKKTSSAKGKRDNFSCLQIPFLKLVMINVNWVNLKGKRELAAVVTL